MPNVNPLLYVQIKAKKNITTLINNVIATVSIPLYIVLKKPGVYNEGWFNVNKDGVKTEGKVHLSIYFEPDRRNNSILTQHFLHIHSGGHANQQHSSVYEGQFG